LSLPQGDAFYDASAWEDSNPFGGIFFATQGTLSSISQPLIRNILQRLALLKPAVLLKKEAHRLILSVGRVVRAVRPQKDIRQLVQQMSRR
jgi:hypothetical protein